MMRRLVVLSLFAGLCSLGCLTPVDLGQDSSSSTASTTTTSSASTSAGTSTGTTSSTGTTGTVSSTGTTGNVCGCATDADCNDADHMGFVCHNDACVMGLGGAVGTSGGGCATNGSTSGSSGTTGSGQCTDDASCGCGCFCLSGACECTGAIPPTCQHDDDCGPACMGLVCVDNQCRTGVGTSTTGSTGSTGSSACSSDASCGCGCGCVNGTCECTGALPPTCASDADCGPACLGLSCQSGSCVAGAQDGGPAQCQGAFEACDPTASACCGGLVCTGNGTTGGGSTCVPGGGTTGSNGGSTPLVLSFDGEPVRFTQAAGRFDLAGTSAVTTDWVAARTPWLALDVNGNNSIDDGRELFGSMTVLPGGARALQGFEALRALDTNRDGVIDARDAAFGTLRLWADADQDRRSSATELSSLANRGVVSIALDFTREARCDARDDCEVERASFTFRDEKGALKRGEIVDVHLANRRVSLSRR